MGARTIVRLLLVAALEMPGAPHHSKRGSRIAGPSRRYPGVARPDLTDFGTRVGQHAGHCAAPTLLFSVVLQQLDAWRLIPTGRRR